MVETENRGKVLGERGICNLHLHLFSPKSETGVLGGVWQPSAQGGKDCCSSTILRERQHSRIITLCSHLFSEDKAEKSPCFTERITPHPYTRMCVDFLHDKHVRWDTEKRKKNTEAGSQTLNALCPELSEDISQILFIWKLGKSSNHQYWFYFSLESWPPFVPRAGHNTLAD